MFVVIDKARLAHLIEVTRDDRRRADQGPNGPFYRIEASDQSLRLAGRRVEVTVSATVHEPGVLFLRVALFQRWLRMVPDAGFISIQANFDGLMFGDTRILPDAVDMLIYIDPATAPARHPAERDDMPEQLPPAQPLLFDVE